MHALHFTDKYIATEKCNIRSFLHYLVMQLALKMDVHSLAYGATVNWFDCKIFALETFAFGELFTLHKTSVSRE